MDIYTALAEPTRRGIVEFLLDHGRVSDVVLARIFRLSPLAMKRHLGILLGTSLINAQNVNGIIFVQANGDAISEFEESVRSLQQIWSERLYQLETVR